MNENYYENDYGSNDMKIRKMAVTISLVILAVILFLLISIGKKCISTYNYLVDMQEDVKLAESNVENMMQRRLELTPDLVSTVKAATKHKEKVYTDLEKANKVLKDSFSTCDPKQISQANENLSIAINQLKKFANKYSDLTDNEQYTSLMDQLEGSVNRIAIAREEYNEKITSYNKMVKHFPGNLLAKTFGFEEMEKFKADKAAHNPNLVDMED